LLLDERERVLFELLLENVSGLRRQLRKKLENGTKRSARAYGRMITKDRLQEMILLERKENRSNTLEMWLSHDS
jgi:hypothetical protein